MDGYVKTACPHDCPSACALEAEVLSPTRIGRIRGSRENPYTAGIICAKVARYAERAHHPDRLTRPLRRIGPKGEGRFVPIGWDEALDEIADRFGEAARRQGAETVWPYHSGGTMGVVQRWGLDRLRHAFGYSRQKTTICVTPAESGWNAGVGRLTGVDPQEMALSDLIVVWGGNPVATQVTAMTHITAARKARDAKLVVIDAYRSPSVQAADMALILRPGTDAALALAVMHVILRDGLADRAYLAAHTDWDEGVEAHIRGWTPERAATVTGLAVAEIEAFARLYGTTGRSFLRPGFGFTRGRGGAAAMHAVSCLPAMTGAWAHEGGGAFFLKLDWALDLTLAHGLDMLDPATRVLDQSRIGPVLCGEPEALAGGPPVTAMLMQNANSATVAPDSHAVRRGLQRDDLFLCVHEQFMTATARFADIVLPAAMFLEYDDIYYGLGHTFLTAGPRVLDRHAECRTNHELVCDLAQRLGSDHPSFRMSATELLDATLQASGRGTAAEAVARGWVDCALPFRKAHFLDGFPTPDGRFRFKPDWASVGPYAAGMQALPDMLNRHEVATESCPFRLITPPARSFLNTTFTNTPGSRRRENRPSLMIHEEDAAALGIVGGSMVAVGNARGKVELQAVLGHATQPGVVVAEGIWPDEDGQPGINQLIGADPVPPNGGSAFHDTAVWVRAIA